MWFNEYLTLYRVRSGSRSSNKWKLVKSYIDVMHRMHCQSLLMLYVYLLTHMFVKTFFKYKSIRFKESVVSLCNPVKKNVICMGEILICKPLRLGYNVIAT